MNAVDIHSLANLTLSCSQDVDTLHLCNRPPSESSEPSSRHTPEQENSGLDSRNCSEAGFEAQLAAATDDTSLILSECSTSGRDDDQSHEPLLREYADRFTMHPIR